MKNSYCLPVVFISFVIVIICLIFMNCTITDTCTKAAELEIEANNIDEQRLFVDNTLIDLKVRYYKFESTVITIDHTSPLYKAMIDSMTILVYTINELTNKSIDLNAQSIEKWKWQKYYEQLCNGY